MAPGYLTDWFALNNRVHVCHTCNCTNIPFQLLISVALFHILLETRITKIINNYCSKSLGLQLNL